VNVEFLDDGTEAWVVAWLLDFLNHGKALNETEPGWWDGSLGWCVLVDGTGLKK